MDACISQLTTTVMQVLLVCSVLVTTSSTLIPHSEKFSEVSECKGFLLQCFLFFSAQIGSTDQHKSTQFINLLMEKAIKWVTTVWEKGGELMTSYQHFVELFHQVFIHSLEEVEISKQLLAVKQGRRRVVEYALEFCMLAAGSGWNETALKAAFHQGLNPKVLTEISC